MTDTPLRWHGGKGPLASWIRSHFPTVGWSRYVEPYAGGLSVLLAGDGKGVAEFVNDLNGELTNFWRVLASPTKFARMLRIVEAIPLAETFWRESAAPGVEGASSTIRAARFFVRVRQSRQGLGRCYVTPTNRLRRGINEQVSAWLSAVDGLAEVHARLRRVEVWHRPALDVIRKLDSPSTLFYLDPPYLPETRSTVGEYGDQEMAAEDHADLLAELSAIEGRFILSGYWSEMYDDQARACRWRCAERMVANHASSSAKKPARVECLWMNYDLSAVEGAAAV